MSLILHIDTSLETASVCLGNDGQIVQLSFNKNQKDHAEWLHVAIQNMMSIQGHLLQNLDAIAISIGPGSYTGLRIGLSTAKGLCFALKIPLIAINTLEIMAFAARNEETVDLLCPVIDARRMEIFTAVYTKALQEIIKPHVMVLQEDSFSKLLSSHKILFFGNGSQKIQALISNNNALFKTMLHSAGDMVSIAYKYFIEQNFADLAYIEPDYLKEFFSISRKSMQ